ncbi:heparan-alpha-glucosaminide N-acetyltransferase domain-containing protein [Paucibacter sp. R3-3]|uniref:Heparan-alpha-glucosaminide N-acetyltransferase domain-containing protein n=1 Tax=Roseateles agri TaxID=3098619 RepID=A0ABU5DFU6_9BURK|nr:heparan-alpha-glucosaminide N-acetyltransferase domain-containing protein [Paucibacter sp. R3-3]MDY0745160.1 heparan-alpha-glucosaminide N-acetyltransferase domain-containing protein [Paucibacter sp. R3-3]
MASVNSARLASVDALRGLAVAGMLLVNDPGDWDHVYAPLEHAAWNGWTPTDLIYPFFLFIVGVSLSLAMGAKLEAGQGAALRGTVLKRGLRILVLGLVLHALAWWLMDKTAFRVPGVLQRIGLCFALAGLVATRWRSPRAQWLWIVALLLGYGLLLKLGGPLDKAGNIASRIDARIFGPHGYEWDPATGLGHDPEGLVGTLGALATTLLGWRCGEALRHRALARLAAIGVGCALLGLGLDATGLMPINKNLWTPAFVLWTGGLGALALLLVHRLIDVRGWPAVGRSFGVNAIAAYAGAWMCTVFLEGFGWMGPVYAQGFGWLEPLVGPYGRSLAFAVVFVAVWWVIVKLLDERGIYIKV